MKPPADRLAGRGDDAAAITFILPGAAEDGTGARLDAFVARHLPALEASLERGEADIALVFPRPDSESRYPSDKLLEDAQRDWSALGQERLLVTPLSRFAQGRDIPLTDSQRVCMQTMILSEYAQTIDDARRAHWADVPREIEPSQLLQSEMR